MRSLSRITIAIAFTASVLANYLLAALPSSDASATAKARFAAAAQRAPASGPFNSHLNNLTTDFATPQSETTVAVCGLTAKDCTGETVMVGYNDGLKGEGVGYSYSLDGGTSWTDGGTIPHYKDASGSGINIGDPALAVDKNGVFYFAEVAANHSGGEFIGVSQCKYSSTAGSMKCGQPAPVTPQTPRCNLFGWALNSSAYAYDKPAITYDPVKNRIYVTWTYLTYTTAPSCLQLSETPQFAYYSIGTKTWSPIQNVTINGTGTGTDPVTKNGKLYVFYEDTSSGASSIQYFTLNNGVVSNPATLEPVVPGGSSVSACKPGGAFDTQAFDQAHAARTNEYPSAVVDGQGNIDVTWNGVPSPGQGSGNSVIYVATLPSAGGSPYFQALPDKTDNTGQLLLQWQPSIAYAGNTNGLAVGYFQVIQLSDGTYAIERDQVTAPASATPSFGSAAMISSTSWLPPPNTSDSPACNEGDYSSSASTPAANVVWSYWGDSRNPDTSGNPEQDIYGLYTSVP